MEQLKLHQFNLYCLKQCGKVASRREKHKLILFYKMINSLAPEYLSSLVPPTVGNIKKIVNEYDQEIPQSQTADNPVNITCVTRQNSRQSLQDPNKTTTHFSPQPRAFGTVFQTILRTLYLLNPLNINTQTTLPNHHLLRIMKLIVRSFVIYLKLLTGFGICG